MSGKNVSNYEISQCCILSKLCGVNITVLSHEHHGISNHLQLNCLFKSLIRSISKETSKLCITGPFWKESTCDPLVDFPHKGPAIRKAIPFLDVMMIMWYYIHPSRHKGKMMVRPWTEKRHPYLYPCLACVFGRRIPVRYPDFIYQLGFLLWLQEKNIWSLPGYRLPLFYHEKWPQGNGCHVSNQEKAC